MHKTVALSLSFVIGCLAPCVRAEQCVEEPHDLLLDIEGNGEPFESAERCVQDKLAHADFCVPEDRVLENYRTDERKFNVLGAPQIKKTERCVSVDLRAHSADHRAVGGYPHYICSDVHWKFTVFLWHCSKPPIN
jgi:hypothetical protein